MRGHIRAQDLVFKVSGVCAPNDLSGSPDALSGSPDQCFKWVT